jgi:tetratricopeptide (TPR) repeat protein
MNAIETIKYDNAVNLALESMKTSNIDATIQHLLNAIEVDPTQGVPYFLMGCEYASIGSNDQAEASYSAAILRLPEFYVARFQLGLLQLTNQRPLAAFATWELLMNLGEQNYFCCFATGLFHMHHDDAKNARYFLEKGLTLNSENEALNTDMRGVLSRLAAVEKTIQGRTLNDADKSTEEEIVNGSHVLISGYQQPKA